MRIDKFPKARVCVVTFTKCPEHDIKVIEHFGSTRKTNDDKVSFPMRENAEAEIYLLKDGEKIESGFEVNVKTYPLSE